MPQLTLLPPLLKLTHRCINRLFPTPCHACGGVDASNSRLCIHCRAALPRLDQHPHICHCCALPIATAGNICGHCLTHPPAFTQTIIPFVYAHPLDGLIHQFKYRRQLSSGQLLSELLLAQVVDMPMPDIFVPTPIHWLRRWHRGFNQSELLALHLGKHLARPVIHACVQPRRVHSQKGLSRQERSNNLRRSFAIDPTLITKIHGAHIALIDDVVTTTATARSLSELLMKAGAKRVDIWALARTPEH